MGLVSEKTSGGWVYYNKVCSCELPPVDNYPWDAVFTCKHCHKEWKKYSDQREGTFWTSK